MMKKISLWLLFVMCTTITMGQQKKTFTLDDLIPGGRTYSQMSPKTMRTTWWGDVCVETDVDICRSIDVHSGEKAPLFTLETLNRWLGATKEQPLVFSCYNLSFPNAEKPWVAVTYRSGAAAERKQTYSIVDFTTGDIVFTQHLPWDATHTDRTAGNHVAYVWKHNLYITTNGGCALDELAEQETLQLSADGSNDLVYGQSVHRDEFGIHKGTYWSPDEQKLAFYRMDQSMVPDYPQVDITTRIATTTDCKYPMAGEKMHSVTVGIFDLETRQTVWLQTGDPTDRYFTNISWSPDSRSLYIIELNRDQNHAQLVRYNATTGVREAVLYEETHPKYVEPQHGLLFLPWDKSRCLYQTQRDGYNHLYVFDMDQPITSATWKEAAGGGSYKEYVAVTQLTSGPWVVQEVHGFHEAGKAVVYSSNENHPLHRNTYKVQIKNRKRQQIGLQEGVHYASLSGSGTYVRNTFSSPYPGHTRCVELRHVASGKSLQLLSAAEDPWEGFDVPEITCEKIKAADGTTDLYARLIKPTHFDPTKKYPAVVYVYGGPHAHNVDASRNFLARGWEIYMAQKGYVVFVLDNRGSQHRGLAFENATFRRLGEEEMKDQMEGVKFLTSLPYVDADRLGVHGWSFGGFMTINLMLTYPDVFKVGVAGGPVIDWNYYEVMYGERYMDTPQANPEGYKGSNLNLKAGNLKGRLQIIIGNNDPVCVPQHTLSFLRACIDAGTQPDFFAYPGEEHNMVGTSRVHLHERITRYFEDHLK